MPELIDTLQRIYKDLDEDLIGDIASSLYNTFFAGGAFVGPTISGFIVNAIHFPDASALLGLILVGFSIFYFIFAKVPFSRKYFDEHYQEI